MDLDPDDPRLPSRPLLGMAILALPGLGFLAIAIGYTALFAAGSAGRSIDGPEVELRFSGCPDAQQAITARLSDMGLPATALPSSDASTFGFRLKLPADPEAARAIPSTLASPGQLQIQDADEAIATNSDLVDASVKMDLLTEPSLLLTLSDAATERLKSHARPGHRVSLHIDGARVADTPLDRASSVLDFLLTEGVERERWSRIAAWSVTVDHPLPCPIRPL